MFNSDGFQGLGGDTTFRDHPHSELVFSGSTGSKKHPYMALSQQNNFHVQNRLYATAGVTTSDRLVVVSPPTTVLPPFSGDFASSLYSQSLEIGDVVQFQLGMEILRRKHCRDLLSEVQQQAVKRLRVKEVELEILNRRNIELEEQLMRMRAECQVWFDYAKSTESVVFSLREKLEDVLTNKSKYPAVDVEEGYGDNVGDAESECETCNHKRACMICGKEVVCVVLLPCQHLCVCKGCGARIVTCPICNSIKSARVELISPNSIEAA